MSTRLIELVEKMPGRRVTLVGDLMVDRYIFGNAERLSPEAPVPVLHYQQEEHRLGGAGSVAANLAALGASVRVIGTVGADEMGATLRKLLRACGDCSEQLIEVPGRPTTCKLRLVGSAQHRHPQQLLRLDFENAAPVDAESGRKVVQAVSAALDAGCDVLCVEDYNKGALPADVCRQIIMTARQKDVPVIIDPAKLADYSRYAGATAIKLNRPEVEAATKLPAQTPEQFPIAARKLVEMLNLEAAIVTLDKSGAYLATRDPADEQWLKTKPRQVFDVTGAGDVVLSTVAVARAAGATWPEAVALANIAGGLEVERFGAVPIKPQEILQELLTEVHEHLGKQRTLEQLLPELARHRATGKKIVFTNGCFDIVHLGHVKYFQWAKRQGDLLVVGVNTDSSIRRLKGDKRPLVNELDRVGVLEELESIDYLIRFDEDTPIELIRAIGPDVLVKGEDYAKEQVVGWDLVESRGGRVALAPLVDGRSTTGVIQKILDAYR
jgi:D-beta-D-heptose 7-phosphate kinase/D-beta-D-heptose 1-phosphate adenosyltransferase